LLEDRCKLLLYVIIFKLTHTQPFYGSLDFVREDPGELVPEETFTHSFFVVISHHLFASSTYGILSVQFTCLTVFFHNLQVFFGLPLGLAPSTSYSIHFFTQSLYSFCSTCPYHHNLFCCSTNIMSSNPSLSLNLLHGTLSCSFTPHIHLNMLISVH